MASIAKSKGLMLLAIVQLPISILILILDITCVGFLFSGYGWPVGCYGGTGIWVGIFAIITASIGIAASRMPGNRCLLTAYFVLCIIASVFTGVLIILSAIYAGQAGSYLNYLYRNGRYYRFSVKSARAGLGINICLVILSFLFALSAIFATAMICVQWGRTGCCTSGTVHPAAPTVVYVQAPTNASQGAVTTPQPFMTQGQPIQGQVMFDRSQRSDLSVSINKE